jgi:hypothetical protein
VTNDEGRMMQTRQRGFTRPRQSAIRPTRDLASYVIFVSILALVACGAAVYLIRMPLKELVEAKRLDPGAVTQAVAPEYMMALVRIGMGLFVLLLAIILSAAAWGLLGTARELDRKGSVTLGKIVGLWKEEYKREVAYYVAYQFGDGVRAWQTVGQSLYDQLRVGDAVIIRFLPDAPQFSRPEWDRVGRSPDP